MNKPSPLIPKLYLFFGLLMAISGIRYYFRPNFLFSLIFSVGLLILFLELICRFIFIFTRRDQPLHKRIKLTLVCLSLIVTTILMQRLGITIRDFEFRKRIDDYNFVVSAIRAGYVPHKKNCDSTIYEVDESPYKDKLPPTVIHVIASRCDDSKDNDVEVIFFTSNHGGAIGIKTGFIYTDFKKRGHCHRSDPNVLTPLGNNWYSFREG